MTLLLLGLLGGRNQTRFRGSPWGLLTHKGGIFPYLFFLLRYSTCNLWPLLSYPLRHAHLTPLRRTVAVTLATVHVGRSSYVCYREETFIAILPGKLVLFFLHMCILDFLYFLCPFYPYSTVTSHLFPHLSTRSSHLPLGVLPP